jgi:hypothetical protein
MCRYKSYCSVGAASKKKEGRANTSAGQCKRHQGKLINFSNSYCSISVNIVHSILALKSTLYRQFRAVAAKVTLRSLAHHCSCTNEGCCFVKQAVLEQRPGAFSRQQKMCNTINDSNLRGVFSQNGDVWKRHRRLTSPAFRCACVHRAALCVCSCKK